MEKSLGQVGFDAYGNAGPNPWKTFDGRDMPKWSSLQGEAGVLTQARWQEAAKAIVAEHEQRQEAERGWRWDPLARRYTQVDKVNGPAIDWGRKTGA